MKFIKTVLWSLLLGASAHTECHEKTYNYLDIAKLGYEQYQDIFINGEVVQKATGNHKDCDARYQIINSFLSNYKRPFTMLDIGASQGYYSFRAAFAHPESVFVMLEGNNKSYPLSGSQLLDLCKANTSLNNIVLLNKELTIQDAKRLSECEHFDVVLALNIIHWFKSSWKQIADIILNMGSHIIVETPPQEPTVVSAENNALRREIEEYLLNKNAQAIGQVPRHTSETMATLYLLSSHKDFLERKTWITPLLTEKTHVIEADFNQKKLHKKVNYPTDAYQTNDWVPGINLITFKMYHGAYPTADTLKTLLSGIRDQSHNDWMINNMILQGNKLQLIDFNDPTHNPGGPGGGNNASIQVIFDNHAQLMDITDPVKVEHYFWNYLIRLPIKYRARNRFVKQLIKKDDLVFDVGSAEGINTQLYVSHHAKVISVESDINKLDVLHKSFDYNDQIVIIGKRLIDQGKHSENEVTLQELIDLYGTPQYCALNVENSESILFQLGSSIKCISFPFEMANIESTDKCVKHLMGLGYQSFNFSCREIPLFMLTDWENAESIMDKIKECAQKDHESNLLRGFVYARMAAVNA